eukprot:TRINITY_DN39479_c0_g1_i1.p2 TRINITY_DN39479_c0_g1~~TRINITY_DN39479_c0_g1_i1.p2  ORF type:complete len:326 (-),score=36.73 TRINITY_DN39479_c0_g1_i1:4-981(-)
MSCAFTWSARIRACRRRIPPWHRGLATASLFDTELRRCPDGAAVLRVAARSEIPFVLADVQAFLDRLKALGKMPRSGGDLRCFLQKVEDALPNCGQEGAQLALTVFAELRCRQGALGAWPLVLEHREMLAGPCLADSVWAVSAVPNPPREVVYEAVGLAPQITPHMAMLPEGHLYRSVYGLARIHEGRGSQNFLCRAERGVIKTLQRPGPCAFTPSQLVRLCWALARLGCTEKSVFEALEVRLGAVVGELQTKELEALYGVLTDLQLVGQWKLIHDIERALEARQEQQGDPNKAPRRRPFRRRWTRASLMNPVVSLSRDKHKKRR